MRQRNFLELAWQAPPSTVADWNDLALRAIRAGKADSAAASCALFTLHTSMYNAWAAYDDHARQTPHGVAVRLPRAERSAASKACAMSHAAHVALAERFPAQRAVFDAHSARLGLDPGPASLLSPAGIGRTQAAAMLDACRDDVPGSSAPAGAPPAADWFALAQRASRRAGHDDDRDVLLYFALAHALADADAAGVGRAAAAAEVLHRFSADVRWEHAAAADACGRKIGAQAFERARRYRQGLP